MVEDVKRIEREDRAESFGNREFLGQPDVDPLDRVDIQTADRLERNTVTDAAARVAIQRSGIGSRETRWRGADVICTVGVAGGDDWNVPSRDSCQLFTA